MRDDQPFVTGGPSVKRALTSALVAGLLSLSAVASAAAAQPTKFVFNDVTYSDGTVGELQATTKVSKSGTYIMCSYYSDNYVTYLGYYESNSFSSDEASSASAVEQFCLDHYADRISR
jgi:hypothetical protein